jgi:hypothetical protein
MTEIWLSLGTPSHITKMETGVFGYVKKLDGSRTIISREDAEAPEDKRRRYESPTIHNIPLVVHTGF